MKRLLFFCLLVAWSLHSCKQEKVPPQVQTSFYHWQSYLDLQTSELAFLDSIDATKLFIRFFDIDWSGRHDGPVPVGVLQADTIFPYAYEVIPTVFITNRTFQKLEKDKIEALAVQTFEKISAMASSFSNIKSVQLDCDWSSSTRESYFQFLQSFKRLLTEKEWELSVTIRLHQLRYPKQTGVPAVDRGMLMFYNMGTVSSWEETNSILNLSTAKPYLHKGKYPIPLDIALPLFRWGAVFRDGKLIQLINSLDDSRLAKNDKIRKTNTNRYIVEKSTYLDGYYLYQGDQIRIEQVDRDSLRTAANMLQSVVNTDSFSLAFYQLDTTIIQQYPAAFLDEILAIFQHEDSH